MSWSGCENCSNAREAALSGFQGSDVEVLESGACGNNNYVVAWRKLPTDNNHAPETQLSYVIVDSSDGSFWVKTTEVHALNVHTLPKKMRKHITKENVHDYDDIVEEIELSDKVDAIMKTLRANRKGVKTTYNGRVCFLKDNDFRKGCFSLYSRDGRYIGRVGKSFARELVARSIKD